MNEILKIDSYKKALNDLTFTDYYNRISLIARSIFEWKNLPNNINEKWIEKFLFHDGMCMFYKDKEKGFMVSQCTLSGYLNHYDEPTLLRPHSDSRTESDTREYENGEDCIFIQNNDLLTPTRDTVLLFAYRLTEISRAIDVNINAMKFPILIKGTEKQKVTLQNLYKKWSGCEPVIFADRNLDTNDLSVLKTEAPIVFDKLQIQKHAIWNECMTFLGINNANMDKRERLVDDEVQANNEQIKVSADTLLKARKNACERINSLFGLNISVDIRSGLKSKFEGEEAIVSD